ncbi:MAG: succinate dehydrogenase cytochrome b subunit [Sandaracinaceae bacterium]|nr:succinate dehydrogenase cytochrome b subunit [Sandaracinaceae bacterium]
MQRALTLYQSTIGKKVAMALSGLVIIGFSIGHMLGNLNAYAGEVAFNEYAEGLANLPFIVWPTRFLLLACFGIHIASAFTLVTRNKDARPQAYHVTKHHEATFASKAMPISGIALFLFVGFHLLHFTLAPQLFNAAHFENPFWNFYAGLSHPVLALVYIAGNLALGLHIYHGFFSAFQSIGANHPKYNPLRRDAAVGLATILTVANLMFPISVQLGYIEAPAGYEAAMADAAAPVNDAPAGDH